MPLDRWVAKPGPSWLNLETHESRSAPQPGPVGWNPFWTLDTTDDSLAYQIRTGNRGLDSSYNRPQQLVFDPDFRIIAERATVGAQIYAADVEFPFIGLPNYFAIEADIELGGYVGVGCFPAFWIRPHGTGQGEIDIFELMAGQPAGNSHYKGTAILTSSATYNVGNKAVQYDTTNGQINGPLNGNTPAGLHTYRLEKIPNKFTYKVDGVVMGTITQAQLDAQAKATARFADNFENATAQWQPRMTYQAGPPTDGRAFNAAGSFPSTWSDDQGVNSWMKCTRMQAWTYAP